MLRLCVVILSQSTAGQRDLRLHATPFDPRLLAFGSGEPSRADHRSTGPWTSHTTYDETSETPLENPFSLIVLAFAANTVTPLPLRFANLVDYVDDLDSLSDQIIPNSIPWTNAEYA